MNTTAVVTVTAERFEDGTIDRVMVRAFGFVLGGDPAEVLSLADQCRMMAGAPVPAAVVLHGDVL